MKKSLKEGDKAPVFSAISDTGEKISLRDFKGKTVILYFYPKDMTPGCTQQAIDFTAAAAKFKRKNAVVLGVSRDSVERHQKFKTKEDLSIALLADENGELCETYGVWQEKSLYGKKFMGIVRSTFIIDPAGKIAKIYPKVSVKGHVAEVLAALDCRTFACEN